MFITISRWLRLTFPRRIGDVMPQLEDGRYAYICKVCVNTGTVTPGGKALLDELLGNCGDEIVAAARHVHSNRMVVSVKEGTGECAGIRFAAKILDAPGLDGPGWVASVAMKWYSREKRPVAVATVRESEPYKALLKATTAAEDDGFLPVVPKHVGMVNDYLLHIVRGYPFPEPPDMQATCECPLHSDESWCTHAAAVALFLIALAEEEPQFYMACLGIPLSGMIIDDFHKTTRSKWAASSPPLCKIPVKRRRFSF